MERTPSRERMSIVLTGHVDHGKSTIVGRLLSDTDSLPHGKIEALKELCAKNSKPFEYAFLLDALKDEQAQGITIDSARIFFKSEKRDYLIIDAPVHIEFLKNMVTGASRAEAAVLVIDAEEGIRENSRRHGYMLAMLGLRNIVVLVNKMDLVGYDKGVFDSIAAEYRSFLREIGIEPRFIIPVSGRMGDNITAPSAATPWHSGPTLLSSLDSLGKEPPGHGRELRFPVQDIYKFTNFGDNRRILAGTVEAGSLSVGDELIFYPSGKKSRVRSIEVINAPAPPSVGAGRPAAVTLEEQIYVTRGEIASKAGQTPPEVGTRLSVSLFWLGRQPLVREKEYLFKCATAKVAARVERITRVIDASTLEESAGTDRVGRNGIAECVLKLKKYTAFDKSADFAGTGRFVLVDGYEIAGGGIIREGLPNDRQDIFNKVFTRNYKWEKSFITHEERCNRYNQKPHLVLITGGKDTGKKRVAKMLEESLFLDGKLVYFLGIGNLLYGVDADISRSGRNRKEHIRRLAEVAHLMLDSGIILIVTAVGLDQEELDTIRTVVDPERITCLWIGEEVTTDIGFDFQFPGGDSADEIVRILKSRFQEKGIIFKPW